MIVGSGPNAPSGAGFGYTLPRPQIDYPNGTVVYLGATSTASTTVSAPTTTTASSTPLLFTQNRQLWDEGPDILILQQYFNTRGFPLATSGVGSPGNETDIFGSHTYRALKKFQAANGLPATGYFGPLTRALLSATSPSP